MNKYQFINKARAKHGNRYNYDKLPNGSFNTHSKVTITCSLHGDFEQLTSNHLKGYGCLLCSHETKAKAQKYNTEEFISKAKVIHGDKYNYDKVNYVNAYNKVTITCSLHGDFEQQPSSHLQGIGCPSCGEIQKRDLITPTYLYYFKIKNPSYEAKWKIGVTKGEHGIYDRYPKEIYLSFSNIKEWKLPNGKTAYELEQHFLAKYSSERYYKQILPNGNTELFSSDVLTEEDIAHIESLAVN